MEDFEYISDDELEFRLTQIRINELRANPIQGKYDVAHLKEVHRYIFQDLPKAGLWKYSGLPGEFRSPVPENMEWTKRRILESIKGADGKTSESYSTFYSRMNSEAIAQLEVVLKEANPERFKGLDKKDFAEKISALYHELDYLHPFGEGNSRTLRTFTEQIAREAGYRMNWQNLSNHADRDRVYIARDRALVERAFMQTRSIRALEALDYASRYKDYPDLRELIEEKVIEKIHTQETSRR